MTNSTYKNELIKRKFFAYLAGPKSFSANSIQCYEGAVWLWEDFTGRTDYRNFTKTKAEEFKAWLKSKKKFHSDENVSLGYCYHNLRYLKMFFDWLSKQNGYKKITSTDVEYLNLPRGEVSKATQPKIKKVPSLEEIKKVIEGIDGKTEIEMRDRALISLLFLTGVRIGALTSLPIKSFDKDRQVIEQDPNWDTETKYTKRIVSSLIPFPYKKPLTYFIEWVEYLQNVRSFQPTDPLFPMAKRENGNESNLGYFNSEKVEAVFWKNTSSPRKIIEKRFKQAGISYYNPHAFRHLLVQEISKMSLSKEEEKALSQSLGHANVGTTFGSYGYLHIPEERQIEIIKNIDFEGRKQEVKYQLTEAELKEIVRRMKEKE